MNAYAATAPVAAPALTDEEQLRLTLFRWKFVRYGLEEQGFTAAEAERLVFVRWLRAVGRLGEF